MSGVLQPPIRPAVRLWRIEHPDDGMGPFQGYRPLGPDDGSDTNLVPRPCLRCHSVRYTPNPDAMPLPQQDELLRRGGECETLYFKAWQPRVPVLKYAFPSVRTLRTWFGVDALTTLNELGYQVLLVSVPWHLHTRWAQQARYDETRATVLRRLAPLDLLSLA